MQPTRISITIASRTAQILQPQDSLGANLQLNVPILAPKQWIASERAKENISATRSDAISVRRDVAIATARAYLTVIAEHRVLQAAQLALSTSRSFEDYAVTRFEGGVGNRLDAVRASQQRATADVKVKQELSNLVKAEEALGVLMGEVRGRRRGGGSVARAAGFGRCCALGGEQSPRGHRRRTRPPRDFAPRRP